MSYFAYNVRWEPLDAINLVFVGTAMDEVIRHLRDREWSNPVFQDELFVKDGTATLRKQDQGLSRGLLWRFHVRLVSRQAVG